MRERVAENWGAIPKIKRRLHPPPHPHPHPGSKKEEKLQNDAAANVKFAPILKKQFVSLDGKNCYLDDTFSSCIVSQMRKNNMFFMLYCLRVAGGAMVQRKTERIWVHLARQLSPV